VIDAHAYEEGEPTELAPFRGAAQLGVTTLKTSDDVPVWYPAAATEAQLGPTRCI
jgi:hypothetical protein